MEDEGKYKNEEGKCEIQFCQCLLIDSGLTKVDTCKVVLELENHATK